MARYSLHEDLGRRQEGEGSSDRAFGLVIGFFFLLVALSPLRTHHPVRLWALVLSGFFLLLGLVKPVWLGTLNRYWTKLGLLMGRIVGPVVTAVLFYAVVTPTALLFRLLGKDPLRLRLEPGARSYWIERTPPGPAPQTMTNQF
jgi:hypothetical protein